MPDRTERPGFFLREIRAEKLRFWRNKLTVFSAMWLKATDLRTVRGMVAQPALLTNSWPTIRRKAALCESKKKMSRPR